MSFSLFSIKTEFTLKEAAMALAGVILLDDTDKEARAKYEWAFDTLVMSSIAGEIPREIKDSQLCITEDGKAGCSILISFPYCNEDFERVLITRSELVAWCEKRKIYPEFLFTEPTVEPEKTLRASERKTLLNIIRALAELHGIKPIPTRKSGDGWRKAVEALLQELGGKGIAAPVKDPQTLTEHLRAAFTNNNLD